MPARGLRALAALLLGALVGCDPGAGIGPGAGAECTEIGALCQLEQGPLGVCESQPCSPGESPPCLICTSQH